mmetsp:Transcript_3654/g.8001  ORF Transcript_3654/g.8001 Transcript_3654/m.8001 type:complete len:239 (+) Transcript_3654:488-1204(+)
MTRVVYVGNLPDDIREKDLRHLFSKRENFGPIERIDIKQGPNSSAFAFLDFERKRDAEDAVDRRDGFSFEGEHLRVELKDPTKGLAYKQGKRPEGGGGGHNNMPQRSHDSNNKGDAGNQKTREGYTVRVTGLPDNMSWQDLKDHMRGAGEVAFVEILSRGIGLVRYYTEDDLWAAVDKLDASHVGTAKIGVQVESKPEQTRADNVYDYSHKTHGYRDDRARYAIRSRSRSRGRYYGKR